MTSWRFTHVAPPALGLAALLLMSEERYYGDAKRWLDFAEQRVQALLSKRVSEIGHPLDSDFGAMIELMRFLLPFTQAYKRYYAEDLIMGEGGNLSQVTLLDCPPVRAFSARLAGIRRTVR